MVPRMRTIREIAAYFKEKDASTKVTEYRIRKMVANHLVPVTHSGTTQLINLDQFIEILTKGDID